MEKCKILLIILTFISVSNLFSQEIKVLPTERRNKGEMYIFGDRTVLIIQLLIFILKGQTTILLCVALLRLIGKRRSVLIRILRLIKSRSRKSISGLVILFQTIIIFLSVLTT